MNIIGEYSIEYNIYTMFNVFRVVEINYNLITNEGYSFFLSKWYHDEVLPMEFGYYHDNKFYEQKNIDDTYEYELNNYSDGSYSKSLNYVDKDTNKQYRFDGEKFVSFNEKLEKICIGKYSYIDDESTKPSEQDTDLYDSSFEEFDVDDFVVNKTELVLKCELDYTQLNNTTEIGVKTNHGRLVSHDIHPPYNLPFNTVLTLKYRFKLK